ncbi:hypothetical protein [Streptomyces sp. SID8499]|uniref:hypothetical protein n=1 Tax=Streptomyces sp. SID8499 TaxID=2706106 RepID=UPI0013CDCE39|nr:hypothetical protein [Streptomyces sp. SID8499]NED31125.1 hypothetical protein [Streptomyces sp. SID8499]
MAIPGNLLSPTTESVDPNTSGWTSKVNCTLALGTGGRNGNGCLSVKSVAAGEMQARTVSSYPVTEGTVYETFADTAGAVPERIGIRWLDSAGAEISVTWSLTTAAASAAWHRVSVAGAAPTGAMQAQVLLSSTETAANVSHFWENIYLGLPVRTTGNLFDFNTESAEVDASGWQVETNATIVRQVPVVAWAVNWYYAGGHTIAMTASAAGNASVRTATRPSVAAGSEYFAYAYLNPPSSASQAWIELRFYDGSGTQLQATRAVLTAPGAGYYRQIVSDIAPAGAVSCEVAAGLTGATAGQVLRLETLVVMAGGQNIAGNVMPYSSYSFEQGAGGWTTASGVATVARSSPWGTASYLANYSLAVTSATATASTIRSPRFITPGGAGLSWRAQIMASVGAGSWPTVTVRVRWYDTAGADLGMSAGTAYGLPSGSWYQLTADAVAPAGATQAAVEVVATAGAASSVMYVDGAALWQALPLTSVQSVDAAGYVQLTLRELAADYLITVYRVTPDGARTLVRGTSGLITKQTIVTDLMVIEDHEAPLDTPVYYRIELYSPTGTLTSTRSSATVAVSLADINTAWLKDPANPQRDTLILVATPPNWERPIDQSSYVVRGRRNKVVLSGRRQGREGELKVWTRSDDDRARLHLLLDSGNTLLWQCAPGMGVTDMYVSVASASEERTVALAQDQWRAWTLPLTEVDMPTALAVNGAAGRTWIDVVAEFDTCADLLATYATSEALLLDRRG